MKSMKTKLAVMALALCVACFGLVALGCSNSDQGGSDAVAGTETTPRFMPAQHQRYVDRPMYKCYRCHGASEMGNPTVAAAVALPDGHYVNNDPSAYELDPARNQCRSCHAVDTGYIVDEAIFEAAEVESGQDNLYDD